MTEHLTPTNPETEVAIETKAALGKITVEIGDVINIQYAGETESEIYRLAAKYTTGDLNLPVPTISIETPLGNAVRGAKEGDIVTFKTPSGEESVVIIGVQRIAREKSS